MRMLRTSCGRHPVQRSLWLRLLRIRWRACHQRARHPRRALQVMALRCSMRALMTRKACHILWRPRQGVTHLPQSVPATVTQRAQKSEAPEGSVGWCAVAPRMDRQAALQLASFQLSLRTWKASRACVRVGAHRLHLTLRWTLPLGHALHLAHLLRHAPSSPSPPCPLGLWWSPFGRSPACLQVLGLPLSNQRGMCTHLALSQSGLGQTGISRASPRPCFYQP